MRPESRELQNIRKSPPTNVADRAAPAPSLLPRYTWDPYAVVAEFDRTFEDMRRNMESMLLPTWRSIEARPFAPLLGLDQPPSDFFEEPDAFVACLELPGFALKDVDVEVTANRLTVEARREEKTVEEVPKRGYFARELRHDTLRREFALPAEVNTDATKAEFKDGILTVRCPKRQPTPVPKAHRVKVE